MTGTSSEAYENWCLTCDLVIYDCVCDEDTTRILFTDILDEHLRMGIRPYDSNSECVDCVFYKTENCVPLIEWLKRRQNEFKIVEGEVAQEDPGYNYLHGEPEEVGVCSLFESIACNAGL